MILQENTIPLIQPGLKKTDIINHWLKTRPLRGFIKVAMENLLYTRPLNQTMKKEAEATVFYEIARFLEQLENLETIFLSLTSRIELELSILAKHYSEKQRQGELSVTYIHKKNEHPRDLILELKEHETLSQLKKLTNKFIEKMRAPLVLDILDSYSWKELAKLVDHLNISIDRLTNASIALYNMMQQFKIDSTEIRKFHIATDNIRIAILDIKTKVKFILKSMKTTEKTLTRLTFTR